MRQLPASTQHRILETQQKKKNTESHKQARVVKEDDVVYQKKEIIAYKFCKNKPGVQLDEKSPSSRNEKNCWIYTQLSLMDVEKKVIEIAGAQLAKDKKLAKSKERHENMGTATSLPYGDPQSAAEMSEQDDPKAQKEVKKTMKASRNEEGIQEAQERYNRKTSNFASTLKKKMNTKKKKVEKKQKDKKNYK